MKFTDAEIKSVTVRDLEGRYICEAYEREAIPKNDALRKTLRDREIRRLYMGGWTVKQIARKFGLAEPYVHTLVTDVRPEQVRMDLE